MCFSAEISFGTGAILSAIGIATIKKVEKPSQAAFASMPLLFSFQQITEGFVWLSLLHPQYASWLKGLSILFLILAQVFWPLWVPVSIFLLEKNKKRKQWLAGTVICGIIISFYRSVIISQGVHAKIADHHIFYEFDSIASTNVYISILYIVSIVLPLFFSSIKKMWILGSTILISLIFTAAIFNTYLISVWCFFAAVISIIVFFIMKDIRQSDKPEKELIPI